MRVGDHVYVSETDPFNPDGDKTESLAIVVGLDDDYPDAPVVTLFRRNGTTATYQVGTDAYRTDTDAYRADSTDSTETGPVPPREVTVEDASDLPAGTIPGPSDGNTV